MNFKLFANCIPVKGYKRSIIFDFQRSTFEFIPNVLYEILTEHKSKTIQDIKEIYGADAESYIDEYLSFLIKNEFAFLCTEEEFELFPEMDTSYFDSSLISNFIIDIGDEYLHEFDYVFNELKLIRCKHVQVRFFRKTTRKELDDLLVNTLDKNFRSIHLILPFNSQLDKDALMFLHSNYPVDRIDIYNTPAAQLKSLRRLRSKYYPIFYTSSNITDETHCGIISPSFFQINTALFTESLKYNTCLHKKMSIDKNGYIKNCPSMKDHYGHISNTGLLQALDIPAFKALWDIKKDLVNICKDCEFRHICTDCRAYIATPENIYSKPAKCNYDPYTCTWEDRK
jgi:SPASM domain peptide maturase of grasp-with-spasm system